MNHLNNMKVKPIFVKDKTKCKTSKVSKKINFSGFNSPKLSLSMKNEPNKSRGINILPAIPLKFIIHSQLINYKFDVYNSVSLNKPLKKINDNLYKRLLGSNASPLLIPEVKERENKATVKQQKQINNEHKEKGEHTTIKKLKKMKVIKVENNDQSKTCDNNTTISNNIHSYTIHNNITQSNCKNNLTNPNSATQTHHHIRVLRTNIKQICVNTFDNNNNESKNNNNTQTISVDINQIQNTNQKDNKKLTPKESKNNQLPTTSKTEKTNTKAINNEQHQQQPKKETRYTYCVLPGNNSKLIITCMKTRPQWEQVETYLHSFANLYWTPLSSNINFSKTQNLYSQYVNHIEYHSELSNKMNLFVNLLRYCEQNELNLFSFCPLTIIFPLFHESFFEQTFHFSSFYKEYISKDTNNIKYNKYFSIFSNKKLGAIQTLKIPSTHNAGNNLWLIKPINFNRGRCIKVINNLNEILNELHKLRNAKSLSTMNNEHNNNKSEKRKNNAEYILLQKYIEKPLTYKNRKFDIRIWVMYTFKDELFVFREGHLKATSDNYDVNSIDPYVHLTNYSVQKYNSNFSKEEIGNEISFKTFQEELNQMKSGIKFQKDILPKIYNIIKITFKAVQRKIIFFGTKKCFEIFGYDFLIDEEFNPFLIEINTNPGLEESSPLIKMLVHRMVDDALKLMIDEEYNRDDEYRKKSPFEVEGYSNKINMWIKLKK